MRKIMRFAKGILYSVILVSIALSATAQEDSAKNLPNFLLPEFTKCIIKFKSGAMQTGVVNYNIIDEEFVFQQENNYMVLADPSVIDTVFVNDRKFIPFKTGFYELIFTGPVSLFIQHKSNAEPRGAPNAYGTTSQSSNSAYQRQIYGASGIINLKIPDNFKIVDDSNYWISKGGSMDKFTNKRQFLKICKTKQKELTEFIESKNINFKKFEDVVKLVDYYSGLPG